VQSLACGRDAPQGNRTFPSGRNNWKRCVPLAVTPLGLPQDHCAKYLVHRQAEACALLGDQQGLLETWKQYRNYFDGKLEKREWFETRRRYLLGDLVILARSLEENNLKMYNKVLRSLRWKKIAGRLQLENTSGRKANLRWWWVIWVLFMLLRLLFQHT